MRWTNLLSSVLCVALLAASSDAGGTPSQARPAADPVKLRQQLVAEQGEVARCFRAWAVDALKLRQRWERSGDAWERELAQVLKYAEKQQPYSTVTVDGDILAEVLAKANLARPADVLDARDRAARVDTALARLGALLDNEALWPPAPHASPLDRRRRHMAVFRYLEARLARAAALLREADAAAPKVAAALATTPGKKISGPTRLECLRLSDLAREAGVEVAGAMAVLDATGGAAWTETLAEVHTSMKELQRKFEIADLSPDCVALSRHTAKSLGLAHKAAGEMHRLVASTMLARDLPLLPKEFLELTSVLHKLRDRQHQVYRQLRQQHDTLLRDFLKELLEPPDRGNP